ncbi:MAG: hypothetical protein V8S54_09665 [Lachnospiraceae bacterium]
MKINKFTIISICLYAMTFLNIRYFSEYYLLRDACIVVVAIYLFLNIKQIYRKCSKSIIAVMLLFIGILIVSFCFNYDNAKSHRNDLIVFSVSLIEIFMCLSFNSDKNRMSQLINVFYKLQLFFVLLNDMLIFAAPDLVVKYNECYLLGDKFIVGYQHLLLAGLLLTRVIMREKAININVKLKIIGLTLLTLSVATATNSATSLVLIPLFALFVILKAKGHGFIYSKVGYMTILTISTLFVVFYGVVLSIAPVQAFITQILGRSATLTSRTRIYALIPTLLEGKLLWGYGYGTSYDLMISKYYFPNTQNGIVEWIWQGGVFAAIVLVIIIRSLVKYVKGNGKQSGKYKYLYAIACVFAVISSIEIIINLQYLTLLMIVYYLSISYYGDAVEILEESDVKVDCKECSI